MPVKRYDIHSVRRMMAEFLITYTFVPENREPQSFDLALDPDQFELIGPGNPNPPDWTRLDVHQCSNCPLKIESSPHCPLALRLVDLIDFASDMLSYDKVQVYVHTPDRTISFSTTAQRGVSSLMGLYMAVSGCPHTAFFRPMARFHLPYANEEETVYRVTSMYLLYQYFSRKNGKAYDLDMKGLIDVYKNIQIVNTHISRRLQGAIEKDAATNAIGFLDFFSSEVPMLVEESLEELEKYFQWGPDKQDGASC